MGRGQKSLRSDPVSELRPREGESENKTCVHIYKNGWPNKKKKKCGMNLSTRSLTIIPTTDKEKSRKNQSRETLHDVCLPCTRYTYFRFGINLNHLPPLLHPFFLLHVYLYLLLLPSALYCGLEACACLFAYFFVLL